DPDGHQVDWYPRECCHEGDCRPVASIAPDSQGLWMTLVDGYTVFVGPRDNRRPSLDTRWHVCVGVDDVDNITPRITCIFEPGNAQAPSPKSVSVHRYYSASSQKTPAQSSSSSPLRRSSQLPSIE